MGNCHPEKTNVDRDEAEVDIELLPASRGKCSGLLTDQTLNNCFIT